MGIKNVVILSEGEPVNFYLRWTHSSRSRRTYLAQARDRNGGTGYWTDKNATRLHEERDPTIRLAVTLAQLYVFLIRG